MTQDLTANTEIDNMLTQSWSAKAMPNSNTTASEIKEIINLLFSSGHSILLHSMFTIHLKDRSSPNEKIYHMFEETQRKTLDRYISEKKVGMAKEMLMYSSFTLEEIAFVLGHSNLKELTAFIKRNTGLTLGYFIELKKRKKILIAR